MVCVGYWGGVLCDGGDGRSVCCAGPAVCLLSVTSWCSGTVSVSAVSAAPTAYNPEKGLPLVQPKSPAFTMGKPKKVTRPTDYLRF